MTDKSIADVIDNTVNQLSNGVQALGNAIQKVAPNAWKIAVHQQKMLAIQDLIIGTIILLSVLIGLIIYKKTMFALFVRLIEKDKDFMAGQIACGAAVIIIAIIGIGFSISNLTDGFVRYNSAEYYAARDALSLIK